MEVMIQHFMLILMRLASFIWIAPGFSSRQVPTRSKIVLSTGLGLAVYNLIETPETTFTLGVFVFLVLKEVLIGVAIGFIMVLFFSAVEMAGNFVDFQVGFSMAMQYDPALGVNASFYGRLYYWITIMIFFLLDIHHHVIRTLVRSYEYIPLTQVEFPYMGTEGIVQIFVQMFEVALNLAFPLIIVALSAEIVLALLSRTVPQINVLILGMPMKILLSMAFMFVFLPIIIENITDIFPDMLQTIMDFIQSLAT